jgi:Subtilase family/Secretion system C-terminal sorting domain
MKIKILLLTIFLSISIKKNAQNLDNTIELKSGIIGTQKNFDAQFKFNVNEQFDGYYYQLIQFEAIPNLTQIASIKRKGILLLDYIPNKAYLAAIPIETEPSALLEYGIRSILTFPKAAKQSTEVLNKNYPNHAFNKQGQLQLSVLLFSNVNLNAIKTKLLAADITIVKSIDDAKMMTVSLSPNQVEAFINLPFINYVECIAPEPIPDDLLGRSLHRSNAINIEYGAGRKYDGSGITMAVADDGTVGPHIDFQGRLTQLATYNSPTSTHGDMTSGIAAGSGNLNPSMQGMASGAELVSFDISSYPQIYDAVSNYSTYDIVVTSTSFSQGCNDYTLDSKFIDDQLDDNRQLIHSFSAGNNAAANCGYGGITGWGNITGGFKVGKNVFAVANVDQNDVRDLSSSRGPAPDGRIKPDIAANGLNQMSTAANNSYQLGGGTSAACPGIAGICTQLYQAYKQLNGGNNPDATLFKAVLLNTADEIGNPGPDYSFGFGRVNALKAAKVFEQNLYIKDSLTQGDSNSFTINVPANVLKLKVLVHWRDIGGQPGAIKSLVNDINLRVVNPNGSIELPWKLNPAANATTLDANATKGNDNLNNVEQITIDNPANGNYVLKTYGATIPFGNQDYYLTYEFIKDEITLTYPIGGEGFQPGTLEVLRWNAEGNVGDFKLEYSVDNGITYKTESNAIAGNMRQYSFLIPSKINISGQVYLKISRANISDSNDAPIAFIAIPAGLSVTRACTDTVTLKWNPVYGAIAYEVSKLGTKYMDSVVTVTGVSAKVAALSSATNWFSVRAITAQGTKGRRALAIQKLPGTLNCNQAIDIATTIMEYPRNTAVYYLCDSIANKQVSLEFFNTGTNSTSNISVGYKMDNGSVINATYLPTIISGKSTSFTFPVAIGSLSIGNHTLSAFVTKSGDIVKSNDTIKINFSISNAKTLPFSEGFGTTATVVLNPEWETTKSSLISPGWVQSSNLMQSSNVAGKGVMFDNFKYNNRTGPLDALISPSIELPIGGSKLIFDRAYKIYPGFYDSLFISLSEDCGQTYPYLLYKKGYKSLASILDSSTTIFIPSSNTYWKKDTIDLDSFSGKDVIVRFINKSDFGNRLFLDNINVISNSALGIFPSNGNDGIGVYPNPSKGIYTVSHKSNKPLYIELFDVHGKVIKAKTIYAKDQIDLSNFDNGIYYIRIEIDSKVVYKKLIKY